jgi:hypothetical protein
LDFFGRARQPLQVLSNALVSGAYGEREMRVVRLGGSAAWSLVHHEIAPARFDGGLEAVHGFDEVEQLLGSLGSAHAEAQLTEPRAQLAGYALKVFVSCVWFVRLRHCSIS